MPTYTEKSSPGYIESSSSSKSKTKEDIRYSQLLPGHILEDAPMLDSLLKAYYTFLNIDEFIYQETKTFTDVITSGEAQFRISDPENNNDEFFTDFDGSNSTIVINNLDGTTSAVGLSDINVTISNGNELPGSLANINTEVGKTFTVTGLSAFNNLSCTITTIVKKYVGPGPSNVMSSIEGALDIDQNSLNYLELMQKEIAAAIPRNVTVNKRNLYKQILDFYKVRGNSDSIEIFFRLLFNEEVVVERPYDKTLIPSSGNYDTGTSRYLDNKGFLSDRIKLQDSFRFQKFSYLIKTGKNVSDWKDVYDKLVHPAGFIFFGEILILLNLVNAGSVNFRKQLQQVSGITRKLNSAMPERQPGAIGIEDLPILVEMFASIFLPSIESRMHRSGAINVPGSLIDNGVITTVNTLINGSGYLTPPVISSTDAGSPPGFTTASFTPVMANGSVQSITINNGGKNYNIPQVTAAAPPPIIFDGSDDEVVGTGIVNIVDNTIKLTSAEAAALPVGSQVTYSSGSGTAIGGLVSGQTYFIMTNVSNEVTLQVTQGGSQTDITSVGTGTDHSLTGQTAAFDAIKTDGIITGIEISDPGFGYTSPPSITFNGVAISGQSLVHPTISIGIDANGRLDQDNITITNGGSGYQQAFGVVAANANHGSLAYIEVAGLADKNYKIAPTIIISEPTAKDAEGVLLSTNLVAEAEFTLDSNGEITGYVISEPGSGYTTDPTLRIDSNASNEIRAKDIKPILILLLNHLSDRSRTQPDNNYYNTKGDTYFNSSKKFDFNERIEEFGDIQIQSTATTNINKYNVNSFIHTN